MAQQTINVGATANDGTGDGIRTAYIKCNDIGWVNEVII